MNSNKASTSNILKFFKPNKRAVFFVLLAVLVLGFSVNFALADKLTSTPPKPGDAYNTWSPEWQKAGAATYKDKVAPSGTDNNDYRKFLIDTGGYSQADAAKTALLNPSLKPNPNDPVAKVVSAAGGKILEVAGKGVLMAVIGVLSVIASFLKELVSYAAELLDLTLNPSLYNFTSNKMIVQGWTMVRDVCNLFFLLILLFIAICTILKIEKYHAKKTLLTLVIMALLINFSKPIAIFIFDGSQLLMNEFLKQMGGTQGTGQTTSTVVAKASKIANIVYETLPDNNGETAIAVQYLFGVVFLFMLAVAYLVTALMLLIRIIAIMMLIIVSPLAFFAAIIPDFSKMSSSWWSSLFEYSYYGPAAAFFLLLATNLEDALPPLQNISGSSGQIDKTVNSILHYFVVVIFLYASIIMAKKFGGVAGAAIVGNANRFMKWGAGMTKGGGVWGAGARGVAWGGRTTGISGGVGQMIGASRFGKYLTKKGREASQKDREAGVAEALGVKGAKEAREKQKVAEQREQWKKEGKTKADFDKSLNSKDAIERKAAAIELNKQNKVDDANYAKVLDALKGKYATAGHAIDAKDDEVMEVVKSTKKKRADLIAEYEFGDAVLNKGRTKQGVYNDVLGSIKPGDIGEQKLDQLTLKSEFTNFASATFHKLPDAAKLDMAKGLNAKHAVNFKNANWIP